MGHDKDKGNGCGVAVAALDNASSSIATFLSSPDGPYWESDIHEESQSFDIQLFPQRYGTPGVFEQQEACWDDIVRSWHTASLLHESELHPQSYLSSESPPRFHDEIPQAQSTIDPVRVLYWSKTQAGFQTTLSLFQTLLTAGIHPKNELSPIPSPHFEDEVESLMPAADPPYAAQVRPEKFVPSRDLRAFQESLLGSPGAPSDYTSTDNSVPHELLETFEVQGLYVGMMVPPAIGLADSNCSEGFKQEHSQFSATTYYPPTYYPAAGKQHHPVTLSQGPQADNDNQHYRPPTQGSLESTP
ncbi:hypothetical protein FRC12_011249 [Ceratobasidium sp. 428]|nr:hypothetical protein FRC12_011249 [Ceratobasidium sp. 428]